MTKSLISKKVDDLKNKLRKLCKDERELMKRVEELVRLAMNSLIIDVHFFAKCLRAFLQMFRSKDECIFTAFEKVRYSYRLRINYKFSLQTWFYYDCGIGFFCALKSFR